MKHVNFVLWSIAFITAFTGTRHVKAEPYCGVYSVFGAAKALGCAANIDLDSIVNEEFVTSKAGSTTSDLVRAAEFLGMDATPLSLMGITSLKAVQGPLVLHCSPRGFPGSYQHWMLFLGVDEQGNAQVVDGGGGVVSCSIEQVLARWDGHAIALHVKGAKPTTFLASEVAAALLTVAGVAGAAALFSGLASVWGSYRYIAQVLLAVVFSAVVGNCWVGNGYSAVAESIDIALDRTPIPEIETAELKRLLGERVTLIDCRYRDDYDLGHIDNALSVPVDAGMGTFFELVEGIKRGNTIVIYCQSEHCGFSKYSAAMFAEQGFRDILIFRPGYVGWIESHQKQP
ncbi:MAG: rhodanese-like domain-containing protein [Planctomycetales bacterium]|nr:rhodanese-like domain-containing protein [Planctomycetales bacterium]